MPEVIKRWSQSTGNPLVSYVTLKRPAYNNEQQERDAAFDDNLDLFYLDHVLVGVRQNKMIVKTQVEGLDGTIKEYISLGDYEITISGKLVNEIDDRARPTQQMENLLRFLRYNDAIRMVSKATLPHNIESVVVMDYSFDEQAGYVNQIPFRIRLLSDTPEEIKFKQFSG